METMTDKQYARYMLKRRMLYKYRDLMVWHGNKVHTALSCVALVVLLWAIYEFGGLPGNPHGAFYGLVITILLLLVALVVRQSIRIIRKVFL